MRYPIRYIYLLLAITFGSFVPSFAQGQPASEASRVRVNQLIVARLQSGLNLSDADAQKLGVILKASRERKFQLKQQMKQLTAQLWQDTQVGDKKQTEATLKKLQETRDQLDRSDEVMFAEVKTMLDPNQLAQFVLIMDEIRHEIRAVKRRSPRELNPTPGTFVPGAAPSQPQQDYTNQPRPPAGYHQGYVPYPPPPKGGGVWVSD